MPDPQGQMIAHLTERVAELEKKLAAREAAVPNDVSPAL
jgi:hypothetical protein